MLGDVVEPVVSVGLDGLPAAGDGVQAAGWVVVVVRRRPPAVAVKSQ
jgi:hypothetical protein